MNCKIEGQEFIQLHCISPENTGEISALSVYFNPDDGKERLIANCWLEDKTFQCTSSEDGFGSSVSGIHDVKITFPKHLKPEPGTFRCQIPGMSASNENTCRWSFPVPETSSEHTNFNTTFTNAPALGQASRSIGNEYIIGIVFGIIAVFLILFIFLFLVLRRHKCKKNKKAEGPEEVSLMAEDNVGLPVNLSSKQQGLIDEEHKRVILVGLPGTGKTMVLLRKCTQWLKGGNKVHIVSTGLWSPIACYRFLHLMQQIIQTQVKDDESPGELQLRNYFFNNVDDVEKAVNELSSEAKEGLLYVIVDEAGPAKKSNFKHFCIKLFKKVPELHLWAASYGIKVRPKKWKLASLNTPFRFPPAIAREVEKQTLINVKKFSFPHEPVSKEDQSVTRLYHQSEGHSQGAIEDCATCGSKIADLLKKLHCPSTEASASTEVISNGNSKQSPCLEWRDMLLLNYNRLDDKSQIVAALTKEDIPVKLLLRDDNLEDVKDLATEFSDVVWMVSGDRVRGLEKKVVICLGDDYQNVRLYHMSRCTSRLVIVFNDTEPSEVEPSCFGHV